MCTIAIYKLYYCILYFSLSKHKANTAELHPKVRQTCLFVNWWKALRYIYIVYVPIFVPAYESYERQTMK